MGEKKVAAHTPGKGAVYTVREIRELEKNSGKDHRERKSQIDLGDDVRS